MWKKTLFFVAFWGIMTLAPFAYAIEIKNPIKATSFGELINNLATGIQYIAIALAPVVLVFVGFRFAFGSASGDAKQIEEAKKMLWWSLLGIAIAVGASALAKVVVNFAKTL